MYVQYTHLILYIQLDSNQKMQKYRTVPQRTLKASSVTFRKRIKRFKQRSVLCFMFLFSCRDISWVFAICWRKLVIAIIPI